MSSEFLRVAISYKYSPLFGPGHKSTSVPNNLHPLGISYNFITNTMDTITSLAGSVNDLRKLVESLATENGNLRLELRSSTSRSEGSISKLQGSMSQLQQDNDELREEIKTKASDLAILQQNCGVMFRKFGELPLELRQ